MSIDKKFINIFPSENFSYFRNRFCFNTFFSGIVLFHIIFFSFAAKNSYSDEGKKCENIKCQSLECAYERTLCLINSGNGEKAILLLKNEKTIYKGKKEYALTLARAYIAVGNIYWAITTLEDFLAEHPDDCEVISWLSWLHSSTGEISLAKEVLNNKNCLNIKDEPISARFSLLSAFLEIQDDFKKNISPAHNQYLISKIKLKKVFPEDLNLYKYARSILQPRYEMPLVFKVELAGGYTTNALMGSPSDPSFTENMSSPFSLIDFWTRFIPPLSKWVNPFIDLYARGIYFFQENTNASSGESPQNYSTLSLNWRPGLLLFRESIARLLIGYRGDILLLNMPTQYEEAPVVYFEGHRLELELELSSISFFGGLGRRIFDESVRTRWELDGGIGWGKTFWRRLNLLGAVTGHYFESDSKWYDLFGVVGVVSAGIDIWRGIQFKATLMVGLDNYKNSNGYFSEDKTRKESIIKVQLNLYSPPWNGLRVGVAYLFSDKISNIDIYSYEDHRINLSLVWNYNFDLFVPRKVYRKSHIPLDYGFGKVNEGGKITERIQDILRQDESFTRGSSCSR